MKHGVAGWARIDGKERSTGDLRNTPREGARRRLIRWVQRLLMIRDAIDGIGAGNMGTGMIADCDVIIVYLNSKLQVCEQRHGFVNGDCFVVVCG
jgi:hypothetical protein